MTEITANYDETWKEVIGDYFDSFLAFFYPEIYQQIDWNKNPISLDKELEQITASADSKTRHADKLFQVWLLDNQEVWILIHVEVQSRSVESCNKTLQSLRFTQVKFLIY